MAGINAATCRREITSQIKSFIDVRCGVLVSISEDFDLKLATAHLNVSIVIEGREIIYTDNLRQILLSSSDTHFLIAYPGGYDRAKLGPITKMRFYFDMAPGVPDSSVFSRTIALAGN